MDTVEVSKPPLRPLPERVDVAVVGAGFTGLSAALTLARGGANCAVLEAENIGWGASSRNGGMVLPGMKLGVSTLVARYGKELAHQMYAASLSSIDCVENIVREESIDCNFSRCGHLYLASKPGHFEGFRRSADTLAREFNHVIRIVPREQLQSEIGSTVYHGGMVDEVSGGVNPARYVAGLARAAELAGAAIFEQTRALQIDRTTSQGTPGWQIKTSRGALWAREVLIATSGYTGKATPALQKKIIPIGSFIIVTAALPQELAREISPRNRMMYDSKNYLHYYRLTPDRRVLFGGRAAFFPESASTVRRSAE